MKTFLTSVGLAVLLPSMSSAAGPPPVLRNDFTTNSDTAIYSLLLSNMTNAPQQTVLVATTNSLPSSWSAAKYRCTGVNDVTTISNAMVLLTNGGLIRLAEGNYNITNRLTLPPNVGMEGAGFSTVLSLMQSNLGGIVMSNGTGLSRLKMVGSLDVLNNESLRPLRAGNDCLIQSVWIDSCFSGIDSSYRTNVHIRDFKATNLRGSNGWANAIESESGDGLYVTGVYIRDCDRGFEPEDGARNVFCTDGVIINVFPTNADSSTYTISAHTHPAAATVTENVSYRNFYLENSGGIVVDSTGTTAQHTRNVSFTDISINNPWLSSNIFQALYLHGQNLNLKHVKFYGFPAGTTNLATFGGSDITLEDVDFFDAPLYLTGSCSNLQILKCQFRPMSTTLANNLRVGLGNSQNVILRDCVFYATETTAGIRVNGGTNTVITRNTFYAGPSSDYAIKLEVNGVVVKDNTFQGNWVSGAVYLTSDIKDCVVADNFFSGLVGATYGGLYINGATNTLVFNNRGAGLTDKGVGTIVLNLSTNGGCGIGTNIPAAKMQVTANNQNTYVAIFGTTNRMTLATLDTNGNAVISGNLTVTNDIRQPTTITNCPITDTWVTTNFNGSNTFYGLITVPTGLGTVSITNNYVTTNTAAFVTVNSIDTTAFYGRALCSANLLTIVLNAAPTTNCLVSWLIRN